LLTTAADQDESRHLPDVGCGCLLESSMSVNVTFPQLLHLQDFALLGLRLVVAIVFGASGYLHLKDPIGRAKSIEL